MHYRLQVVWKGFTPDFHFVSLCVMFAALLDHRLQHGSAGRTKRTIRLLSTSMDYSAQDHPA